MAAVGGFTPVLVFVDGRSSGIAMASGLPAFQDCRFYVDSNRGRRSALGICFSLQSPKKKGFGKLSSKKKTVDRRSDSVPEKVADSGFADERSSEEPGDDVVPEVVTNRMLRRIALTVGLFLAVGVLFFPLYYYLKVVKKVDVPEWLPLLTSMFTFGTAGLGITYGVLSASWDPASEGSLLGWKEAQLNFPVFLETVEDKRGKK